MPVVTEDQPPTNSVQDKQNVLGIYHKAGSVAGPGDLQRGLEGTEMTAVTV